MKKTIRLAALLACLCMMISVFCSCSSSKFPAGIYVGVSEDEGFIDRDGLIKGRCVFSDGAISRFQISTTDDYKFKSSSLMLSEEGQADFYDENKYEDGRIVDSRSEYNSYWLVKISDNPNEFDGMEGSDVYEKISERLKDMGWQP